VTGLAGFGAAGWLPARVQRAQAAEEAAERREARRAEAARAERAEAAREKSLSAFRAAAELRGEVVSALALAAGEVAGRTLGDIFADARRAGDREDALAASRDRREELVYVDEPVIAGASRSEPLVSEYALGREIRRAAGLHSDLMAVRARHDYRAAEEAARAKASGNAAVRSGNVQELAQYELEVERLTAAGYSPATARQAATPMIYR
jgi:hypothetical protein